MAISQRSNLINVVVHNSADSRNASLSAIILSHVLIEGEKHRVLAAQIFFLPICRSCRGRLVTCCVTDRGKRGEGGGKMRRAFFFFFDSLQEELH